MLYVEIVAGFVVCFCSGYGFYELIDMWEFNWWNKALSIVAFATCLFVHLKS